MLKCQMFVAIIVIKTAKKIVIFENFRVTASLDC